MSASHADFADDSQDGVFRIDPYWFEANPGDPPRDPFRLHWGRYQPSHEPGDRYWVEFLKSQYPKWDEFLQLAQTTRPEGIFLTSYWRDRFGL